MALPEPHSAVLRWIVGQLLAAGVRHGVGGSGLLAMLGLPVTVRDLDIEVEPDGFDAVIRSVALSGFAIADPYAEHGPIARTSRGEIGGGRMYRGRIGTVPVEIFEHPRLRVGDRWQDLPLRSGGTALLGGDEIPLAEPAFWWALYSRISPAKADLLAPLVPERERSRAAAELGLPG